MINLTINVCLPFVCTMDFLILQQAPPPSLLCTFNFDSQPCLLRSVLVQRLCTDYAPAAAPMPRFSLFANSSDQNPFFASSKGAEAAAAATAAAAAAAAATAAAAASASGMRIHTEKKVNKMGHATREKDAETSASGMRMHHNTKVSKTRHGTRAKARSRC